MSKHDKAEIAFWGFMIVAMAVMSVRVATGDYTAVTTSIVCVACGITAVRAADAIRAIRRSAMKPTAKLAVDGVYGKRTAKALETALGSGKAVRPFRARVWTIERSAGGQDTGDYSQEIVAIVSGTEEEARAAADRLEAVDEQEWEVPVYSIEEHHIAIAAEVWPATVHNQPKRVTTAHAHGRELERMLRWTLEDFNGRRR